MREEEELLRAEQERQLNLLKKEVMALKAELPPVPADRSHVAKS